MSEVKKAVKAPVAPVVAKVPKAAPVKTMPAVKHCDCVSEFQDSIYGKGMRAMNAKGGQKSTGGYCCTVCGKTK
jgi:hypothetical protein